MVTKFITIEGLNAVGMRHWCKRSLHIGEVLMLVREPENPFDENAIALYNQNGSDKNGLHWKVCCRRNGEINGTSKNIKQV